MFTLAAVELEGLLLTTKTGVVLSQALLFSPLQLLVQLQFGLQRLNRDPRYVKAYVIYKIYIYKSPTNKSG